MSPIALPAGDYREVVPGEVSPIAIKGNSLGEFVPLPPDEVLPIAGRKELLDSVTTLINDWYIPNEAAGGAVEPGR